MALPRTLAFDITLEAGAMGPVPVEQWAITVSLNPDPAVAQVRIAGAIDLDAAAALDEAAEQLRTAARPSVLVDLAEVTFACSTLINFLIRVRTAMPHDAKLVVSRATPRTRRLLTLTGVDAIVVLDDRRSATV